LQGEYNFWSHLQKNKKGLIKTWAIFWYANVFLNGGLCLHPSMSYVKNIGHDGSGVHCGGGDTFSSQDLNQNIKNSFINDIVETRTAFEKIKHFYRKSKKNHMYRIIGFVKRIFK
jgi:hypothetical protein